MRKYRSRLHRPTGKIPGMYYSPKKNRMIVGIPNDHLDHQMNDRVVAQLWREVARARRTAGDRAGAKQAFVNARMVTR